MNAEKYKPLEMKEPEKPNDDEDDSEANDFAFLTGVNIKGQKR